MAQHDYNIANQTFPSFRSDLNNALSAIQTNNSGTSLPTGAVAGQIWLDTTNATSPTLKFYDGTDSISLATINYTANTVDWLDSTVSVTGLSTSATGTVLTLSDSVNTTTVNLIIDNQKEIRFRETTANGTNYIAFKAPASVASDLTFTLPATDGSSGQALVTNGSGVLSFASAGLAWQTIVTASTLTAVAGRGYWINTTSNACTITLPASASNGDTIILVDYARTWGTNAVTLNQNSLNFQGYTSPNPIYNTSGQSVTLIYSGATQGWIPTVDDDVTLETPQSYSVDFLVVAGGGSGGGSDQAGTNSGGGGGAGGYRTSTQSVGVGTVITATVGDGGSSAGLNYANGSSGSNSSISGSGLTTITSAGGGGGGGGSSQQGQNGGSGGGSINANAGGLGNTPSTSPSQGNNGGAGASPYGGSGGGAAGAVGASSSAIVNGIGGNGTASSITGSSVTYAGGGGGGGNATISTGGAGGTGGGGAGGNRGSTNGVAGTTNLGGGGGGGAGDGSSTGRTGGSGGKGVVILSVPTASYSGTSSGSPTITTSGANTILKFTGTGSYTA